jgi:hypothetical protein
MRSCIASHRRHQALQWYGSDGQNSLFRHTKRSKRVQHGISPCLFLLNCPLALFHSCPWSAVLNSSFSSHHTSVKRQRRARVTHTTILQPTRCSFLDLPSSLEDYFSWAYAAGARIHSNSWGHSANTYDDFPRSIDECVSQVSSPPTVYSPSNVYSLWLRHPCCCTLSHNVPLQLRVLSGARHAHFVCRCQSR